MNILQQMDARLAAKLLIALLSFVVAFHLLVLAGIIPYHLVWGGRLESDSQMYRYETTSLLINLVIIAVIAMRGGFIKPFLPDRAITFALWLLMVLFALNTLGNLFASTNLEAILFTPVTFISTLLCFRLAKSH